MSEQIDLNENEIVDHLFEVMSNVMSNKFGIDKNESLELLKKSYLSRLDVIGKELTENKKIDERQFNSLMNIDTEELFNKSIKD